MAGEYILELLRETTATINYGNRWLANSRSDIFTVYEKREFFETNRELIVTNNEEEACRVLKGE